MTKRLAVVLAVVLLLAGCSTPDVDPPTRTSTPAPATAAPAVPDIPRSDGRLVPPRASVPPVTVEVPSAGITVPVVPVGVLPDGLMELPPEVSKAGWYRYGADPLSETGTTVISAHVDSARDGLGPFSKLKGLPAGAEVVVTTEGGVTVRYVVESVTSVLKEELPLAEVFDRAGDRRLALITCGGQFDRAAFRYSDNVVVIAVPVES